MAVFRGRSEGWDLERKPRRDKDVKKGPDSRRAGAPIKFYGQAKP